MDEDDVVGIRGGRAGGGERRQRALYRAAASRRCGVVDVDHAVRRAGRLVDRHDRRLVGADDVLVAHHRLLHLVGHVAAPAASHPVGEPGEARPVEVAVVVSLQGKVPVVRERHVEPGVDAAEPGDDVLAGLRALPPVVAGVAQGIAADADHPRPVGETGDVGTDFEVGTRQGGVETVLAHDIVLIEGRARGTGRVGRRADRHVAVGAEVAEVGEPLAADADLVVGVAELAVFGAAGAERLVLVLVAVEIPEHADAEQAAAEELFADEADVREEAAVDGKVAAQVGRPQAPEVVLGVGDVAAERHVGAVVAEAAIGGVEAVVEEAGAVLVELLETCRRPVEDAAGRDHGHLPGLGLPDPRHAGHAGTDRGHGRRLPGCPLPGRRPALDPAQPFGGSFSKAMERISAHRSRILAVAGWADRRKPARKNRHDRQE